MPLVSWNFFKLNSLDGPLKLRRSLSNFIQDRALLSQEPLKLFSKQTPGSEEFHKQSLWHGQSEMHSFIVAPRFEPVTSRSQAQRDNHRALVQLGTHSFVSERKKSSIYLSPSLPHFIWGSLKCEREWERVSDEERERVRKWWVREGESEGETI